MLEKYLIGNCSPTLASLKSANLFCMPFDSEEELYGQITYWNEQMRSKGIRVMLLREHPGKAQIYVCRIARLEENLRRAEVAQFLKAYGYEGMDAARALLHLKERFANREEFPHEIGIFLDYPLGDVIGFIENAGRKFKCSGCWKVYCDECEALKMFTRYKKCRDIYQKLWRQGRSVLQLTVPARAQSSQCSCSA